MEAKDLQVGSYYVGAFHDAMPFVVWMTKEEIYGGTPRNPTFLFYGLVLSYGYSSYREFSMSRIFPESIVEEIDYATFAKIQAAGKPYVNQLHGGKEAGLLIRELYDAAKIRESMKQ